MYTHAWPDIKCPTRHISYVDDLGPHKMHWWVKKRASGRKSRSPIVPRGYRRGAVSTPGRSLQAPKSTNHSVGRLKQVILQQGQHFLGQLARPQPYSLGPGRLPPYRLSRVRIAPPRNTAPLSAAETARTLGGSLQHLSGP